MRGINFMLSALLCLAACAPRGSGRQAAAGVSAPSVEAVLEEARRLLGQQRITVRGKAHRPDCSGFIQAIYSVTGLNLAALGPLYPKLNGVGLLYNFVQRYGKIHQTKLPKPGDLAFFDNSYDRNRNRKLDDELTHVAVVESIDSDGTVTVIHRTGRGVVRGSMNLFFPDKRRDRAGKLINAYLRRKKKRDNKDTPYLLGQLHVAFGRLPPSLMVAHLHTPGRAAWRKR